MSGPEERQRAVNLYFTTPMTTAQVVRHLGYPTRQCLERWLARDPRYAGHMVKPIIPLETRTKAIELVPGSMQQKQVAELLGAGLGAVRNWVKAHREGGMAALRPKNRNAGQDNKPAMRRDRDAGDAEALRRRIEELELENAVMREVVVEARGKRPRRRPTAPVEPGEDASDRPSAPDVFTQLDDMLARHRTEPPPTATTPGSGSTNTPGCVSRWPRRSPLPRAGTGTAGSRPRSEPASRRRCSAGSWPRTGLSRMYPDDAGTAHTRARPRRLPATSPTAISRLGCRTRNGPRTSPGSRPGMGRACLSPSVDCYDGRIVAYTAGSGPNAELANRMLVKAAESLPEGAHPLVHSDRGCHCRWPGWLALMDRYGLTRSTGAKGCSPDNAAAEGSFGRMKTESVYPGHWEERTRDGVLVLIDDCIRWYNHERVKRSLGWMSPVQYRQSQGTAA